MSRTSLLNRSIVCLFRSPLVDTCHDCYTYLSSTLKPSLSHRWLALQRQPTLHMKAVVIDSGDHSTDMGRSRRNRPADVERIDLRWCILRHCPNNSVFSHIACQSNPAGKSIGSLVDCTGHFDKYHRYMDSSRRRCRPVHNSALRSQYDIDMCMHLHSS